MQNGYKILWTDLALAELETTIIYLEEYWTERELRNLAAALDQTLMLISSNPFLFQVSDIKKDIRRVVIVTFNTLYYKINGDTVEVLSFFSNRKNPKKRKL
ncbi:type II toxin-antitoxin system RelE/ParE family toxin [Flavobacterium psychrotrophum]|uniref:type II toxin-antitoxin system RelE/ParE family toxin n=1 Tax=Flavobacterium psychrotrophum TaxID=2294119 RepID=UPI000E31BA25|nr:type II toxin-antitoxin system RelE/ParE family toxin [Flavobacterium psychrotrophum]